MLKAKFRGGAGHQLAITWGFQFVDIARALSQKAAQSPRTQKGKQLLASFMEFVQTRIDTREIKLQQIQQQGIGDRHNLFEYLWVFESTLWELALVSASCLSMADIASALRAAVPGWAPTVSLSETQLEETLKVGGTTLQRVYFPSGTAAAEELYQILWKTEFSPFGLEVLPQELSTFTPYFEFYQASATLLHRQTVQQRSGQDAEYKFAGTQIWLNLSDGLHSAILDSLSSRPNVGALIAVLASGYIQQLIRKRELEIEGGAQDPTPNLQRVCLVIDFTKFTGDMPNDRLYPLLVQLRETLLMITSRQHAQVVDVVFLRSNLKYNTGSLDRYQSGELLFAAGGEVAKKGIGGKLSTRASASFQGEWLLNGEYIPLMKRTYLLADAIGFNRWTAYSQTWAGGGASSTRSSPYDASLLALKADLVGFVDHPLDPIVSNLVVDIRKQSFKRHLGGQTTQRVSTFWTQVVNDRNYLKDLGWKELGASTPRLRALAGALQKDLELIIEGIHGDLHPGGKPKPKRERSEAYEHLSRYLARLRDARKKLPNLDAITPVSTPALVAPVPPPTLPVASSLTPLAGKHCSGCDTVHGSTPSLLRRWHVCRDCGAIFCWWCGFKLKSYVFPDLDEVLDAMVKDYSNPNVRACTHCQGPTQLA
ncbi:hypothetical protein [Corallococcus sp. RDP092CA]|uniref:hypothetical protein n=1 Tax=Corallococcus sp. RDP092CA TaxID=3109369 RepID=UPI0035B04015